jgi:hypothetical protein
MKFGFLKRKAFSTQTALGCHALRIRIVVENREKHSVIRKQNGIQGWELGNGA